jgi:hypothetical protein
MAAPTLKKKQELNYRRGRTSTSCRYCNHAVLVHWELDVSETEVKDLRCWIMGLKPGRAYKISPDNTCDAHDNSES